MSKGLTPVIKHLCPECDFEFRYNFRDPDRHPSTWVLTAASSAHLLEDHSVVKDYNVVPIDIRRSSKSRNQKTYRLKKTQILERVSA